LLHIILGHTVATVGCMEPVRRLVAVEIRLRMIAVFTARVRVAQDLGTL
jgi:hypothetical protein